MQLVCLLIDRVNKADDNAEFFYRWLRKNKPEVQIYFGLESSSPDWERLSKDRFNLLDLNALKNYKKILSTVTHLLVSNPIKKIKEIAPNAIRIFLQHGITNRRAKASADYINDCMKWADYTTATSEAEKHLLTTAPYTVKKSQVYITGFPRHDELCHKKDIYKRQYICLQPHWAMYLDNSNHDLILNSIYFKSWAALLQSPQLKQYCQQTGNKIAFRLHPCSYDYEEDWKAVLPKYIKYIDKSESFQKTFAESLVYVSDYSSNMFEVGVIDTPCIYFRPDADYIRNHTDAGDFEANLLGVIGPSAYTIDQFIQLLTTYTNNNFKLDPTYQETRKRLFPFKLDRHNCERVYEQLIVGTATRKPSRLLKDIRADGQPNTFLYF